jgi:hypothetical protein
MIGLGRFLGLEFGLDGGSYGPDSAPARGLADGGGCAADGNVRTDDRGRAAGNAARGSRVPAAGGSDSATR